MYSPLVISPSYLIDKTATGQIQRVFWEYLYDEGFHSTIICSQSRNNDIPKERMKCNIFPTQDSQLIRYFFAFLKRAIAPDFAHLPDYRYYSWAKNSAIKRAKYEAKSGNYDYIHSVCMPFSSHLIALEAKKVSRLPWIASFYDPWFDNPYRLFKFKSFYERDRRNEATVAKNADAIIHTNHAIYNEWVERYGDTIKDKLFVMPLVFNPSISSKELKEKKKSGRKFIISHIGSFYPERDSADFLKAIRLMLNEHPEIEKQVEIYFVGAVTDNDRINVQDYNLSNLVRIIGYVSEKECVKYFEQSDLFIAVDGKNARNIFFPSKVLKYFYYGKPILGLTPQGSALQYELQKSHNFSFENEDYIGVANFLYRIIAEKGFPIDIDTDYWKNFTMKNITPQYESIVSKVIKQHI